jgi:hypothetical protein
MGLYSVQVFPFEFGHRTLSKSQYLYEIPGKILVYDAKRLDHSSKEVKLPV